MPSKEDACTGSARGKSHFMLYCLFFVLYRTLIAFTERGAESPDEWWQSAEVAYFLVFQKGTVTWEWNDGIRSIFFPCLYAFPYYILKVMKLDNEWTIYIAERLVQTVIAASIDICTLTLARQVDAALTQTKLPTSSHDADDNDKKKRNGKKGWMLMRPSVLANTAVLLFFHWYMGYTSTRSYSNVAECLFFLLALLQENYACFLFFAGVACMVRVTALMALLPLFVFHFIDLVRQKGAVKGITTVVTVGAVMVLVILTLLVGVDYIFYQRLILTPYNFFFVNIFLEVSKYYGVYPWSYYFLVSFPITTGFSVILLFFLPQALSSESVPAKARRLVNRLFVTAFFTIFLNSFVAHKENRFLFLLLPVTVVLCAFVIAMLVRGASVARFPLVGLTVPNAIVKLFLLALFVVGTFLFIFFGYTYRTGPLSLMAHIRHSPHVYRQLDVMTCCYATPGYSQVHSKVQHLVVNDCPMILDPVTKKRQLYEDLLYRKAPVLYLKWRYTRSPVLYKDKEAQKELFESSDDSMTTEEFWPLMKKLFPENERVQFPDGLMLFSNIARALNETVLIPNGYVLEARTRNAFVIFEPHEDLFIDLWRLPH